MRTVLLVSLMLLLPSCADREGPSLSWIRDVNNELLPQTPDNVRRVHQNQIAAQLRKLVGGGLVEVAIAEHPWYEPGDSESKGHWWYSQPQVTITVTAEQTPDQQVITSHVSGFMRPLLDRAKPRLTTVINHQKTQAAPVSCSRSYTVQANDTLAAISSAFYGTPQHWRLIADANHLPVDATLTVGTVLIIPPRP